MGKACSVCHVGIEGDCDAILALGAFGTPRYLCDGCAADFDDISTKREIDEIDAAIDRISKKMTSARIEDETVLLTVGELMVAARERREKIRAGEYDFSEDAADDSDDEIPEELRESAEDAEAEKTEAEKNEKYDKITNAICIVLGVLAFAFIVYRVLTAYFI